MRSTLAVLTALVLLFSGISQLIGWGGMILVAGGDLIGLAIAVQGTWSPMTGVAIEGWTWRRPQVSGITVSAIPLLPET